jgi:hypothetical protein
MPPYRPGAYSAPPYMAPPHQMGRPIVQSTNGYAIASLVLSILGVLGIGSLLGIIFGVKARREIRDAGGYQGGDGMALAGIIIGIVTLVLFVIFIAIWIALFATLRSTITNAQQQQNAESQSIQSCEADTKVVEVALDAYQAELHSYPTPPAPWSATTYLSNYGPLTADSNGGPFLHSPPSAANYTIEYDSQGHVWVAPPETFESSYDPSQDVRLNTAACGVAVTP